MCIMLTFYSINEKACLGCQPLIRSAAMDVVLSCLGSDSIGCFLLSGAYLWFSGEITCQMELISNGSLPDFSAISIKAGCFSP